jgi:hypothetical protein
MTQRKLPSKHTTEKPFGLEIPEVQHHMTTDSNFLRSSHRLKQEDLPQEVRIAGIGNT